MTDKDYVSRACKFLHKPEKDVLASRVRRDNQTVILIIKPGSKFTVNFDDLPEAETEKEQQAKRVHAEQAELVEKPAQDRLFVLLGEQLSQRQLAVLEEAGLDSRIKLKAATDRMLLRLPSIGEKTVEYIRKMLESDNVL